MERVIELLQKAKQGDKLSRDTLIEENVGLVWSIVRRFGQRGYDYDDLFQIGMIGLIKAVDYFNTEYDVKFSTYAVPMITGEIRRFLRDDGMVKVSRSIKDNASKIHKIKENYFAENGKEASAMELSQLSGIELEDVIAALEASAEVDSLQKVIYQGDNNEICLMDKIEDPEDASEKVLNKMLINDLLNGLKPNEKDIIILRYYCNQTQSEIAKRLGISQVQVSRIEKKILASMRSKAELY